MHVVEYGVMPVAAFTGRQPSEFNSHPHAQSTQPLTSGTLHRRLYALRSWVRGDGWEAKASNLCLKIMRPP